MNLAQQNMDWIFRLVLCVAFVTSIFFQQSIPLRHDEAGTVMEYLVGTDSGLVEYTRPNQHLLHTLAVFGSTQLFGFDEWAIRLPAFIAGLATVLLTYELASKWCCSTAALLGATGVATHPFILLFASNARGYSMVCAFSLAMALAMHAYFDHPNRTHFILIVAFAVAGLGSIPTFLLPACGLIFWFCFERVVLNADRWREMASSTFFLLLWIILGTSLAYLPTLMYPNGFTNLLGNQVVQAIPTTDFYNHLPNKLHDAVRHLTRDVPPVAKAGWGIFAVVGAGVAMWRRSDPCGSFFPCFFTGVGIVLILKQVFPFDRNWIFFIPFVFVAAALGVDMVLKRLQKASWCKHGAPNLVAVVLVAILLWNGLTFAASGRLATYNDTGRYAEVKETADWFSKQSDAWTQIATRVPLSNPLRYYLWRKDCPAKVMATRTTSRADFVLIRGNDPRNPRFEPQDYQLAAQRGDARIYRRRNPSIESLPMDGITP